MLFVPSSQFPSPLPRLAAGVMADQLAVWARMQELAEAARGGKGLIDLLKHPPMPMGASNGFRLTLPSRYAFSRPPGCLFWSPPASRWL